MQLTWLTLTNFRACRNTGVGFAPDLTVLVGENASGKSAIIDALRLATFPVSGRQTAWFSPEKDLSFAVNRGEAVEIAARYGELSDTEKAVYMAGLVDAHEDLIYTASFATSSGIPRRSVLSWSIGESKADDPEPALRRRIAHVYLPPLRDAVRDLDGGDQAQLHEVMALLLAGDQEKRDNFVTTANNAVREVAQHPAATQTRDTIQDYFGRTTPPNRAHLIQLNEREMELQRIARLLRIQLAEKGVPIGDIASTGLGYANLLYIAMIVLQLAKAKDSDLTLLLVEEPEAHLHPQLQLVLLDFLQQQARSSGRPTDIARPTGKVQVVVTTHSPVLASTVSIRQVVVVARDGEGANWCAKAIALRELDLTPADVRKIDRYLNSTRAALLFARDVVLVEGIAELLLLPALADRHLSSLSTNADDALSSRPAGDAGDAASEAIVKGWRRQFASATIISVEGVDFEPYLHLLLDGPHPRIDRVVVVTDRDSTAAGDSRKTTYEKLFSDATAAGRLIVEVGGTTLEAEMFRNPMNEELLKAAFLSLHPRSGHYWSAVVEATKDRDLDGRAEVFAQAIRNDKPTNGMYLDISKGDFAHLVAEAILTDEAEALVIPDYLQRAIESVAHAGRGRR
jgi:putative ATP-dependent endonuclease of OLD family